MTREQLEILVRLCEPEMLSVLTTMRDDFKNKHYVNVQAAIQVFMSWEKSHEIGEYIKSRNGIVNTDLILLIAEHSNVPAIIDAFDAFQASVR